MGSLDSQFLQNSFQDFDYANANGSYNSYADLLPLAATPVDPAYNPPAYNPFATGYVAADQGHPPRYNPLSQSLPAFPSVCYSDPLVNYPAGRGYNPFAEDYEFSEPEVGIPVYEQQPLLTGPYNYLPNRASTPPSIRQYAHALPGAYSFPVQQEFDQPRELVPVPPPKDAVFPYNPPADTSNSQRLLWLSEEEAEIIRLIRVSQMKENLRSSGFSLCEDQQITPVLSPKLASVPNAEQTVEKAALCIESKTFNLPVGELVLPTSAEVARPRASFGKDVNQKAPQRAPQKTQEVQEKALDCSFEKVDIAKIVDDDRQWIAMQRQKITDITERKKQNAAACIQRHWREHRVKVLRRQKSRMKKRSPVPQKPSPTKPPNNVRRPRVSKRRPPTIQEAARTIQRSWRACFRKKRLLKPKTKEILPTTLKELYDVIKRRHASKNLNPPSYGKFVRILERVHACTEGARVRRRLKTRRLQAVVKEIKEIRFLLEDMLQETAPGSSELVLQLSGQLQQKIIQLHTALQGPGDAARYLLRRGPATPLVIYGSRSTSPTSHLQKSGEQAQIRVIGNSHTETGVPSLRCSLFTVNKSSEKASEGSQGTGNTHNHHRVQVPQSDYTVKHLKRPATCSEAPRKGAPVHEERGKTQEVERSGMSKNARYYFMEKNLDSQLPVPKADTENAVASRLSQYLVTRSKEPDDYGYESSIRTVESDVEQSDQEKPKRPFLRRKSMAMAPQKLDWSKVKPMVSSRLEPELKTKLYRSKVKEIARNAASKKTNYNNVKSRLFNYETSSAVDASGGLSTDRSIDVEYVEGLTKQSYTEIHTQVDMSCKEDYWRPESASSTVPYSAEAPDSRSGNSALPTRPFSPKPPPKLPSYRYGKSGRDSYSEARIQTEGTALEEIDHNGGLERKKQTHSFRYKEAVAAAPETSVAEKAPLMNETAPAKRDYADEQSAKDDTARKSLNEGSFASPELETMFTHVMLMKDEKKMSVHHLFGAPQGNTIIPRLSPDASVFTSSFSEKRKLHELLIHEGRASKLQPDALAYVCIRE
ncbi:hypothetical protein SELMODRAFT_407974 [Selaginella moellendorffii]|uniref:Uncharacterized protein n=1 Tax=Selaginella moellendorffii TaxID=88036 RepID=D8R5D8_SELML|nr:uncharacterized protein LOC9634381 isoform X1 [Selaginella moellendorffii]EFJ32468.1 hypothetical protein SELMODRAFT_407974 [Selaginella moellendorffii]|eukprot:XP_002966441.1 uncharacterized protein LOC9634381 isoform X1 [Selaginella moellendorffii]